MIVVTVAYSLIISVAFGDDYMTPPGAPGSEAAKMKTLNQVEPRTPITSLPFSITNPGSYYLIAPLFGVGGSNGIIIAASDVKLDLNGFALNGVSNSYDGVRVAGTRDNITIRNGVIRNWDTYGIMATNAHNSTLTDVKAFGNGWGGLYIGDNSLINCCAAYDNGKKVIDPPPGEPADDGIKAGSYCTIKDCKARNNKGAGIHAGTHSKITGCTSTESTQADGIHALNYSTIRDCTVSKNAVAGITVFSKCRVVDNTCGDNGWGNSLGAGIRIEGSNNRVEDNNVIDNRKGICVRDSQGGAAEAYGNLIIRNSASGNIEDNFMMSTNVTGDHYGNIMGTNDMGGSFSNSNPWANFQF